ncbi:hypothetical protein EYC80_010725 [Monilinia laxa]|uniref:Uncharacterized protein n=1 Tax=Monilinia laxa TaxID=61186 RepID=A0A5N6JM33_MONLA|nr:hypothetical protein EYC80_010725 [Monilinia laxa]
MEYRSSLDTNLNNLSSWEDLFPPSIQHLDNFTANTLAPLNHTYYDEISDLIIPYGYANQFTDPQPFMAENIIIITDGICASGMSNSETFRIITNRKSACSIFTEFMTCDANVKGIAVGGRSITEPMQAIGGTNATLAQPFEGLAQFSEILVDYIGIDPSLTALANTTFPGLLSLGAPSALASYSITMRDIFL